MKAQSINATGKLGTATITDALFLGEPNMQLVSQAVRVYRANLRQGTSSVKTRAQVARTKRKWFKQKGTGNARHGARSAPIFVGGGVAHGPNKNQNWSLSMSPKMKRKALVESLKAQVESVYVCASITKLGGKTKEAVAILSELTEKHRKVLIVTGKREALVERSCQNLGKVLVIAAEYLTALEVAMADAIVFDADAEKSIMTRVGLLEAKATKKAKPTPKKAVKPAAKPAAVKKAAPKKADDLTKVEGIGPKINELLQNKKITTFAELSKTKPESIKEILAEAGSRFNRHDPTTWPKQAKLAAADKWDELKKLQDELQGGK